MRFSSRRALLVSWQQVPDGNFKRLSETAHCSERRRRLAAEDLRYTTPANSAEVGEAIDGQLAPIHQLAKSVRELAVEHVHLPNASVGTG